MSATIQVAVFLLWIILTAISIVLDYYHRKFMKESLAEYAKLNEQRSKMNEDFIAMVKEILK